MSSIDKMEETLRFIDRAILAGPIETLDDRAYVRSRIEEALEDDSPSTDTGEYECDEPEDTSVLPAYGACRGRFTHKEGE